MQKCGEVSDTQRPTVEIPEPHDVIDPGEGLFDFMVLRYGRIEAGRQYLQYIGPLRSASTSAS